MYTHTTLQGWLTFLTDCDAPSCRRPSPPPSRLPFPKEGNPGNSVSLGGFKNAFEQESMQIAALDRSILRDRTGILSSIFVVRTCNTNNGQDLYILLSKTLYFIESFSHILKQTTLTWKKYNKDAIKVLGRFDKNLNVTRTNISFFPIVWEIIYPGWQAFQREGKEDFGCVRSTKDARGRRKGNAFLSFLLPRVRSYA